MRKDIAQIDDYTDHDSSASNEPRFKMNILVPVGHLKEGIAAEASMVEARGLADAAISPGSDGSCSCVFRTKFRMDEL